VAVEGGFEGTEEQFNLLLLNVGDIQTALVAILGVDDE
jgi:hypothetical protein